jgi:hypothetical protein
LHHSQLSVDAGSVDALKRIAVALKVDLDDLVI